MDREGCDPVVWGPAAFQKENTRLSLVGAKRHLTGGRELFQAGRTSVGQERHMGSYQVLSSNIPSNRTVTPVLFLCPLPETREAE